MVKLWVIAFEPIGRLSCIGTLRFQDNPFRLFSSVWSDLVHTSLTPSGSGQAEVLTLPAMLCGRDIGCDRLERIKLLQDDPSVEVFEILVKQTDRMTVFHKFLQNISCRNHQ